MALVELARFPTKVEADIARLLLEAEGLDVILFDEGINHLLGGFMPVRVMIPEEQSEAAAGLLVEEGLL